MGHIWADLYRNENEILQIGAKRKISYSFITEHKNDTVNNVFKGIINIVYLYTKV